VKTGKARPSNEVVGQVMFVAIEESAVRLDMVLLDGGVWGRQELVAGTPISICVDRGADRHLSFAMTATAWATAMATLKLVFVNDGNQQRVLVSRGVGQMVLSMRPFD
jgi:hypothetical protein